MPTQVYHVANICIRSELEDFSNQVKNLVYNLFPQAANDGRFESKMDEATENKIQFLVDEVDFRRELGQFVHP